MLSLEGHFVCVSGLHTDRWIHKDRYFTDPKALDELGHQLADAVRDWTPELVCGPATGGLLLGYATARALGCPLVFTEGERLRRGFDKVVRARRVVLVDDIANTGLTLRSAWQALVAAGAQVVGVAVLIQRGALEGPWTHLTALSHLELRTWKSENCPLCTAGVPVNEEYGHGGDPTRKEEKPGLCRSQTGS